MVFAFEIPRRAVSNTKLCEFGVVGTTHMTPTISINAAAIAASNRISSARTRSNHVCEAMELLLQRLFDFRPGIAKSDSAIENEGVRFRIQIHAKVSLPLELESVER